MSKISRILHDETVEAAELAANMDRLFGPFTFLYLTRRHPDGVRVYDIADKLDLTFQQADHLVRIAEVAGRLKVRRGADGGIRFVWPTCWMPPLTNIEKLLLRQAQRDLANGAEEIWLAGAAMELRVSEHAVRSALEFLVFADLLKRNGKAYALTRLGRTEGETE